MLGDVGNALTYALQTSAHPHVSATPQQRLYTAFAADNAACSCSGSPFPASV